MLKHWLIDLIGHVSGLSDAQLRQIEESLPATRALIDLLNRAQPMIEQAHSLYAEAEPLIDQAKKEWQTAGPAVQILIDVISHHVNKGSSPAEAAEAVRTALDGSIKSVAQDHWMDREITCVTVFGGTGFVGRRVARHLRESGATVRIASRHPKRAEDDRLEQIAANAHDERSVEAAQLPDQLFDFRNRCSNLPTLTRAFLYLLPGRSRALERGAAPIGARHLAGGDPCD